MYPFHHRPLLGIAIFIYAAVTVYQNFPELIQQYQQLYEMYQGGM